RFGHAFGIVEPDAMELPGLRALRSQQDPGGAAALRRRQRGREAADLGERGVVDRLCRHAVLDFGQARAVAGDEQIPRLALAVAEGSRDWSGPPDVAHVV